MNSSLQTTELATLLPLLIVSSIETESNIVYVTDHLVTDNVDFILSKTSISEDIGFEQDYCDCLVLFERFDA